ncbi:MAG: adenylyl-sulfate kinase [Lachnospiraceae bacterium]|nr:adenylyl-sulfate kinase [Lachnospiraceae bacterium]
MDTGIVYWLTGLSGAGKTTIGEHFFQMLRKQKENVIFLDGDVLREVFGNDLGYSKKDRFQCAMRYSRLCKLLSEQGQDVVLCTISMFRKVRDWNRQNINKYKEIYIEVPMEVLEQRNQKGLYQSGGDVVGVDLELELPENPDLIMRNGGDLPPQVMAQQIWNALCADEENGND